MTITGGTTTRLESCNMTIPFYCPQCGRKDRFLLMQHVSVSYFLMLIPTLQTIEWRFKCPNCDFFEMVEGEDPEKLPELQEIARQLEMGEIDEDQMLDAINELDIRAVNELRAMGEGWLCSKCGESVPVSFAVCWKCGTPAPEEATVKVGDLSRPLLPATIPGVGTHSIELVDDPEADQGAAPEEDDAAGTGQGVR